MKIGVLTSSRADFGIYTPLLKELSEDSYFKLHLIAFGTHLSSKHGATIEEIRATNLGEIHEVRTLVKDGSPVDIAHSYVDVVAKFAEFWNQHSFDLVLCLGDRYEMSAAIQASIPYGVKLAHFHGGETTLGAIDNIYRHQISLVAKYHFTAAEPFSKKLTELLDHGNTSRIITTGSMSLANLTKEPILSLDDFLQKFRISTSEFVLCTIHPETVGFEKNEQYAKETYSTLKELSTKIHLVINYPNADTNGNLFRNELAKLQEENANVTMIESFGKIGYFSAMKYARFLLGNSSSGIIEAASFNKMVINIGERQAGRLRSKNTIDVPFDKGEIIDAFSELMQTNCEYSGENVYVKNDTLAIIINALRKIGNGEL